MNWMDYVVIGIIVGYAFIGYARGFIYSVFKVASFFVSALLSIIAYPYVSKFLISTFHLDEKFSGFFTENLNKLITPEQIANTTGTEQVTTLISSWGLPKPIETMVTDNLAAQASQTAGQFKQGVTAAIGASLSVAAVNIISIIAVFAIVSFALIFARNILQGIAKLPIFKQINRTGGFIFGTLEGLIVIYIGFAILALFSSVKDMQNIFGAINSSLIAKQFYTNNLLLLFAFGAKK